MSFLAKDRVKQFTVTSGTGNLTLLPPASSFFSTYTAGITDSDMFAYAIIDTASSQWEIGYGHTASPALVRDAVLASSNNGARIVCSSATKEFFVTHPAIMQSAAAIEQYGTGEDGDITLTGPTTLTTFVQYDNLTFAGSAQLTGNVFFPIKIAGLLDLTNAVTGAFTFAGANGANASANSAGLGNVVNVANHGLFPQQIAGSNGSHGSSATGSAGNIGSATTAALSFLTGSPSTATAGAGGSGANGPGGAGGFVTDLAIRLPYSTPAPYFPRGALTTISVSAAPGGGSGGGDGSPSGGGGSGAVSGGSIVVCAKIISRGSSTAAGAFWAAGGVGGNGGVPSGGNRGGGGGGTGGSGGYIKVVCDLLIGSTATGALAAPGGAGGNGAAGTGTGTSGTGASGNVGGRIEVWQLALGTRTVTDGSNGSAPSGTTGGAGGACSANL